jgi:uncharacterized protein (TIGR02246 family)
MNSQVATKPNEAFISDLYHQLLDAWIRRDAAGFADLFTADGSLVGFGGSTINGQTEGGQSWK